MKELFYNKDFEPEPVQELIDKIIEIKKEVEESGLSIHPSFRLYICSTGGSTPQLFRLIDFLNYSIFPTFDTEIIICGEAKSSAAILVMAFPRRLMTKHSFLMFHHCWWDPGTCDHKDLNRKNIYLNRVNDYGIDIVAESTGLKREDVQIMFDDELYINAKQALELGLIHEII